MLIDLICSDSCKKVLTEIITTRGLHIDPAARIVLVEKGFNLPIKGLCIVFEYQQLPDLMDFLDQFAHKPEKAKALIVGRQAESETYEIVTYEEIFYFEADGNHTFCMSVRGKLRVKGKLYELESDLVEHGFIRISKSLIVNVLNIAEIIPWFGSRLLLKLKNNQEIEVSRNYTKEFKEYLEL